MTQTEVLLDKHLSLVTASTLHRKRNTAAAPSRSRKWVLKVKLRRDLCLMGRLAAMATGALPSEDAKFISSTSGPSLKASAPISINLKLRSEGEKVRNVLVKGGSGSGDETEQPVQSSQLSEKHEKHLPSGYKGLSAIQNYVKPLQKHQARHIVFSECVWSILR